MTNERVERALAIAKKEWRLNLRFATEYFVGSLVTPLKSALVMIFLYSGFLKSSDSFLGSVTKENYLAFVLLGSTLHSQITNAAGVMTGRIMSEKYTKTALATLLSPASIYEVLIGYAIGSGGLTLFVNVLLLALITFFYPVSLGYFLVAVLIIFLVALFGFGIGLIGATIGLVWEGKLFLYSYGLQLITLLSCLYYPIGIMPRFIQPTIRLMPTYQLGEVLHALYSGTVSTNAVFVILYMAATSLCVVLMGGFLYDHSIRRYGVVGY